MTTLRRRWFALGLGLLSIGVRIPYIGQRPLWYDEAFSLLLARQPWAEIVRGTAADTMPPLYYFLLNLWLHLGGGVAVARAMNVLLGSIAVIVLWRWIAEAIGEAEGRLAAVFAALSPFLIYHAQELRMYTLLLLGSSLYGWGVIRLLRDKDNDTRSRSGWLLTVGGGAVAMYSHNLALFTLAAPVLALLLQRRWSDVIRVAKGLLAIMVVAAPWLVVVPRQIAKIQTAFWTPTPGPLEVLQALLTFHTHLPIPEWAIPVAVTSAVLVVTLICYSVLRGKSEVHKPRMLWAFLLVPPAGLLLASYLMRPVFVPRAFIASAVAYYGLVAWAALEGPLPGQRFLLSGAIIVPALLVLPAHYTYQSVPRSPFEQAAEFMEREVGEGAVVVHDNKLSSFPMEVYAPELPSTFIRDEPGSHNDTLAPATQEVLGLAPVEDMEAAAGGAETVWFVVFERAEKEYRQLGEPEHPRILWLRERYSLRGTWDFNDLNVYLFQRY